MVTAQQSDSKPETPELFGGPRENPIGSTEADFVRAARAAVDASFDTPKAESNAGHPELPVTPALFGGAKESVIVEVTFEERFNRLERGMRNLAGTSIVSM